MGNFAFLKFNPCCSVYPRTAARQIRSYGFSAENPSTPAIGAQYLNVSPIMETLVFALEEAAEDAGMTVEEFKKVMENTPLQAV